MAPPGSAARQFDGRFRFKAASGTASNRPFFSSRPSVYRIRLNYAPTPKLWRNDAAGCPTGSCRSTNSSLPPT